MFDKDAYVYTIGPIDFSWETLTSVDDAIAAARKIEDTGAIGWGQEPSEIIRDFIRAKELAREEGWEGDFTEGPCVFPLPDPGDMEFKFAFVWKQSNNGFVFVVSPFRLPHLE